MKNGIRGAQESRWLGDVYKGQALIYITTITIVMTSTVAANINIATLSFINI